VINLDKSEFLISSERRRFEYERSKERITLSREATHNGWEIPLISERFLNHSRT